MSDDKTLRRGRARVAFDVDGFRAKMRDLHITQQDVAEMANVAQPNVAAVLGGHSYLGPGRAARLMDALHALALEVEAKRAAEQAVTADAQPEPERKERPQPRIRRL